MCKVYYYAIFSRFCEHRWVEDEVVAERALEIWPNFVRVIKDWESQCKSKRPKNGSYEVLVASYKDVFVSLRMEFFRFVAKILHEFLVEFQTDSPMVPFLSDALEKQMQKALQNCPEEISIVCC